MKDDKLLNKFRPNMYMKPDAYLNGWAKKCGWKASIVYDSLWRHADKNGNCFPSIELMADEFDVSRDTIIRGLKTLISFNLVKKESARGRSGKFLHNTYTLTDKSQWKDPTMSLTATRSTMSLTAKNHVANSDYKGTQREGYTTTDVDKFLKKAKEWAYKRSDNTPNCNTDAFESSILKAVEKHGFDFVHQKFVNESNAIQFLVNIK
jgi:hypothetical protein